MGYLGPIAIGISMFMFQLVWRQNTRGEVLESRVARLEAREEDHKENFTKLFETLNEIKVELAKLNKNNI